MPFSSIIPDHDQKLIISKASGPMDAEIGKEFIAASRRKASEYEYNILYDIRELDLDASISDMYGLVKNLPEFQDNKSRHLKVALLISKETPRSDNFSFYETAAQNEGLIVKLFMNEEEAMSWLK